MKKAFTLLLVFCLILSLSSAAFAAGAPKIKKQPVSQTTDKGGNVTFEFEATGFTDVSWRFVNPETGEEWTGKQLADVITAKGFTISVDIDRNTAVIRANREGLLSLANHMISLAEESSGSHIHLDEYNALEEGSAELIVEKA